ncbi:hypothetical protein PANG_00057 [Paenibacillus phage PG1]|uniref:hypothetical protein n=1 Tax=Paenibacillus phage PG1 TaxID=754053 RepID=UPI000342613A|nr:hypothetical protein PANG_00057 [Paenibacillus phage PG1]AGN33776.1 hypothetical protein PANG_00057 [Paenibacillus phage PG1]
MINWTEYDQNNPPELNKVYLVCASDKDHPRVTTAKLEEVHQDRLLWWTPNGYIADRVTHYAPINLPRDETTE